MPIPGLSCYDWHHLTIFSTGRTDHLPAITLLSRSAISAIGLPALCNQQRTTHCLLTGDHGMPQSAQTLPFLPLLCFQCLCTPPHPWDAPKSDCRPLLLFFVLRFYICTVVKHSGSWHTCGLWIVDASKRAVSFLLSVF